MNPFTPKYSKAMTTVLTNEGMSTVVMAMFDTLAGSSLIREDLLPTSSLANLQRICVSVKPAGDTSCRVDGVIGLSFKFGADKAKTIFRNFLKLAAKAIIGTAFLNEKISGIETRSRKIIPGKKHALAIVTSLKDEDAAQFADGNKIIPNCITKVDTALCREVK